MGTTNLIYVLVVIILVLVALLLLSQFIYSKDHNR
jgi:hypothetical protein